MTEVVVDSADQQSSNNTATPPVIGGAGRLLRQAREQQQMSVQALASTLKVPVYKLQALEEDRWDVLTDSVFTRSLALSVCRLLHIPAEPVLAGLPKHEAAKLASNPEGINAPFKEKTLRSLMSSSQDSGSSNAVKVVAALLIAVAGGAGLYFVPQWQAAEEAQAAAAPGEAATDEPLFMPQLQTEPETPVAEPSEAKSESATAVTAASAAVDATATPPATVTAAAEAANAVAAAAEPASKPAATANGRVLRFAATGESWVQVRDAQQQVVMEKMLKAGDVYQEATAGRPLQIVVGNASATTLEIDGVATDLTASAKNNVARFEVK
ncbi:helix-turn-helix domain-containing protein [Comamonas jiangduensis]|uniref:helix-turn-helix domain-containing protein n=1 Tax=Comamonas jiangduensis TaxID=1194168 RepID=UPI0028A91392|nr:helix-turn-helix domain-containing protein [Comamonas jiangduensis]